MMKMQEKNKGRVFTVPNVLSMIRLCLIPIFVWLYCVRNEYLWTAIILILSGITDVVDGYIARHFNAISDLGKIIDPIADKLTQGAMLICLCLRFPYMIVLILVMAVKEISLGVATLVFIKKTGSVQSSRWHGKVATVLLYATVVLHVLWINIPPQISTVIILISICMILLSFALYGIGYIKALLKRKNAKKEAQI